MRVGLGELGLCALLLNAGCARTRNKALEESDASATCATCASGGSSDVPREAPDARPPRVVDASTPMFVPRDAGTPPEQSYDAGAPRLDGGSMPDATVEDAGPYCPGSARVSLLDDAGMAQGDGLDNDCDGIADRNCTIEVWSADKRSATRMLDDDCDGVPEACEELEVNAYGYGTRVDLHVPCGGPTVRCGRARYDAYGAIVERMDAPGGCEGPDSECWYSVFDPPGTNGWPARTFIDQGCDGTPDRECLRRTDRPSGNPKTPFVQEYDEDCDGTLETGCLIETKDASDKVTSSAQDANCDGVPDRECETWEYDASGRLLYEAEDKDCDGAPETWERTAFDAQGQPVTRTELTASGCFATTFQDAGATSLTAWRRTCDGPVVSCIERTYDGSGRTTKALRSDCRGTSILCEQTTYNDAGQVLSSSTGQTCDAPDGTCIVSTYDDAGRELTHTEGTCGAAPKVCWTRTYLGDTGMDANEVYGCGATPLCKELRYSEDQLYVSERRDLDCDGEFDKCGFKSLWETENGLRLGSAAQDPECLGFR